MVSAWSDISSRTCEPSDHWECAPDAYRTPLADLLKVEQDVRFVLLVSSQFNFAHSVYTSLRRWSYFPGNNGKPFHHNQLGRDCK